MSDEQQESKPDNKDNEDEKGKFSVSMFGRLCGIKPDQLYAFVKNGELEDEQEQTLDQWKKLLQDFVDRPV